MLTGKPRLITTIPKDPISEVPSQDSLQFAPQVMPMSDVPSQPPPDTATRNWLVAAVSLVVVLLGVIVLLLLR